MHNELSTLTQLQKWYASMCDGDWEHTYGIFISNIDNPGWHLKIDLVDSYLESRHFDEVDIQREDENDWIQCSVDDRCFLGYGGPYNLNELIEAFLAWAEND